MNAGMLDQTGRRVSVCSASSPWIHYSIPPQNKPGQGKRAWTGYSKWPKEVAVIIHKEKDLSV